VTTGSSDARSEGPPPNVDQEVAIEGLFATALTTMVETVSGDLVSVSPPRMGGVELPLGVKQEFTLSYRVRGARCEVACVVVQGPRPEAKVYVLQMQGTPHRIQRREDVRVPAVLELVLRRVSDDGQQPAPIRGTSVDVSLGGLQFVCDSEFRPQERATVIVDCGQFGAIDAVVEVVRCTRDIEAHAWRSGSLIVEIEPEHRRRLSGYLLDRQRLLRRREVGLE
jgi:c-di-GMP-binding flagellar brake protein YcgR